MKEKTLNILEYMKVLELLKRYSGSSLTENKILNLRPMTEFRKVKEELGSTTEGVDLIAVNGALPTGGQIDISKSIKFAVKGGTLSLKELLNVKNNLRIAREIVTFSKEIDFSNKKYLDSIISLIEVNKKLEEDLDRSIISEDEVSDNASIELRAIRRKIVKEKENIRKKLNSLITSRYNSEFLQDSLVTIRNGRFVIPVKQEHRSKFPGMIHGESKGGATVFIEPQAIVNLNNSLKELFLEEEKEIERILAEFSSRIAEGKHFLTNNQNLITELDFIMAKAKLSIKMKGAEPEITKENQILELIEAKHPLLDDEKAVPLNIILGGKFKTLIITGPNTGGKTVALKTAGLLSLMVQSGLHIKASDRSKVPIFKEIFADIGDEQSIEQSLSTFSSHLKNIIDILEEADENSLVLLDEMGAGTDPTEGSALAIAVLENLKEKDSYVLATTHYNEIKKYALSTPQVENASMEFDVDTLSPTYRLLIGVAGRSNAFEISEKLGLEKSIIKRARTLIDDRELEFKEVIESIDESRKEAEEKLRDAEIKLLEAQRKVAESEKKLEEAELQKRNVLEGARKESRKIIKDAKKVSKEVQKELKALQKEESLGIRNSRFEKARKNLKEAEKGLAEPKVKVINSKPIKVSEIKVGSKVKVLTLGQNGTILDLPDKKEQCSVQVGPLKLKVSLEDMVLLEKENISKTQKKKARFSGLYQKASKRISPTINVQGKNLDDAIMEIDKYLDDAFLASLEHVTIIHGRGEGILKDGIRNHLKYSNLVKSFKAGKYDEGGEGITNVTLKIR